MFIMSVDTKRIHEKLPDPCPLTLLEWEVIKEAVKNFDGELYLSNTATELHHKLGKLNNRQVISLVLDRNNAT
jgi:hypothetical protein